jgi:hypothetical protein
MLIVAVIVLAAALVAAFVFLRPGRPESRAARSKGKAGPRKPKVTAAGVGSARGAATAARAAAEGPFPRNGTIGASAGGSGSADLRYAGVELRVGSPACKAARGLAGKVFLMHEAPVLPLGRCDAARCRCSFEKRSDRREENRRWEDHGVQATITSAVERRAGRDRRGSGGPESR